MEIKRIIKEGKIIFKDSKINSNLTEDSSTLKLAKEIYLSKKDLFDRLRDA